MLKDTFLELTAPYTSNLPLSKQLWSEIENFYSESERHYHNLAHLHKMFLQLTEVQTRIKNWDALLFALFYHDIIYKPANDDNEEKSAEFALARLSQIGFPKEQARKCSKFILATKSHNESADGDTNYFTDADLAILGQDWAVYCDYANNVRKEYAMYPDSLYKAGRKNVLHQFLNSDRIFKTGFFFEKYENKSRANLIRELTML